MDLAADVGAPFTAALLLGAGMLLLDWIRRLHGEAEGMKFTIETTHLLR